MFFHIPFGNLIDSEKLAFINECDIHPFALYFQFVFQPYINSDGHDEMYNYDSRVDTYDDGFTCHYFDLDNKDQEKFSTSTGPNFCSFLTFLNNRSVSKKVKRFKWTLTS